MTEDKQRPKLLDRSVRKFCVPVSDLQNLGTSRSGPNVFNHSATVHTLELALPFTIIELSKYSLVELTTFMGLLNRVDFLAWQSEYIESIFDENFATQKLEIRTVYRDPFLGEIWTGAQLSGYEEAGVMIAHLVQKAMLGIGQKRIEILQSITADITDCIRVKTEAAEQEKLARSMAMAGRQLQQARVGSQSGQYTQGQAAARQLWSNEMLEKYKEQLMTQVPALPNEYAAAYQEAKLSQEKTPEAPTPEKERQSILRSLINRSLGND